MNNQTINGVPRELRPVLAMILNALDRDAADGKAARGEMASELRAQLDGPAAQPQGEPVAQGVGVLTFMRSTSEGASRCACCEGDHVFCRYFKGLPDFNDLTQGLRHRNDLEGREFRVTVEALPLSAQTPAPVLSKSYCECSSVGRCITQGGHFAACMGCKKRIKP